jgi:hypothetical protein
LLRQLTSGGQEGVDIEPRAQGAHKGMSTGNLFQEERSLVMLRDEGQRRRGVDLCKTFF